MRNLIRNIFPKYEVKCIRGGDTRNISIFNAIEFIKQNYVCDKVIFHDSVRPLVNSSRFSDIICQLMGMTQLLLPMK